jgi:hypothetical protein
MGATTDAFPPGMARTCSEFWPWRLLHRRCLLRTHRPSARQRSFRAGKPDSPNAKLDHSVFQEAMTVLGRQQGQRAPNEPLVDHMGGSQKKTGPENKSLANDEVKSDAGKNLEEATTEQSKVPGAKTKTRTEVGTTSR